MRLRAPLSPTPSSLATVIYVRVCVCVHAWADVATATAVVKAPKVHGVWMEIGASNSPNIIYYTSDE